MKFIDNHITKNFTWDEVCCQDGEVLSNEKVIAHAQRLQKFRDWYNRPMIINSWYRSKSHNTKVGGVADSQHLYGIATDISLPPEFYTFSKDRKNEFLENIKRKWSDLCKTDGLGGGVGFYDTFFHLDSRSGGVLAFWDERKGK